MDINNIVRIINISYTLRHNRTVAGDITLDRGITVTKARDEVVEELTPVIIANEVAGLISIIPISGDLQYIVMTRDPASTDISYLVPMSWLNTTNNSTWSLVQVENNVAIWAQINSSGGDTPVAEDIDVTDTDNNYSGTNVETILSEIGYTRRINGYDLTDTNSLPDLAFNNNTRTFSAAVKDGQSSFHFWVDDKKVIKTETQSVIIPPVTNTYYIIFDTEGTLIYVTEDAVIVDDFYEHAITGLVYWNQTALSSIVGDERHGILMDARTHHYNHSTFGARYESGIDIIGLVDNTDDYTNTTAGFFWDEDIRHPIGLQSSHPFIYKLGGEGNGTAHLLIIFVDLKMELAMLFIIKTMEGLGN